MGIKGLNKTLRDKAPNACEKIHLQALPKGLYGVDVSIYLHPAKYNASSKGKGCHIRAFFDMISVWKAAGHRLVMVFDGDAEGTAKDDTLRQREQERKRKTDEIRRVCTAISQTPGLPEAFQANVTEMHDESELKAYGRKLLQTCYGPDEDRLILESMLRNTIEICEQDFLDLKQLFNLTGTPFIEAQGEADHMLAVLYKNGLIKGVVSEDSDMLTHGIGALVRGLNTSDYRRSGLVQVTYLDRALDGLGLTMKQFIAVCILSGCDYCDKLNGVATRTAIKLIKAYNDDDSLLDAVKEGEVPGASVPDDGFIARYKHAFSLFTNHTEQLPEDHLLSGLDMNLDLLQNWLRVSTNYTEATLKKRMTMMMLTPVVQPPVQVPVKKKKVVVVKKKSV